MLAPGTLLDNRYRLGALLGQGETAVVYRAHDETLDRAVAVKILRSKYAADAGAVRRFREEAAKAASLAHPSIAQVLETGVDGGLVDVVTQLVDGPDLARVLAERGRLPAAEALRITTEAAQALQAAHDHGIVHGDIKPTNILLTSDGDVRIVDFGNAHAPGAAGRSGPGLLADSAAYGSPEQVLGDSVGPSSDIYSLGVVLYEMLTGRRPFEDGAHPAVAMQRLEDPPPPPSRVAPNVPAGLDQLVLRALAPRPEERYPSAQALADAIRAWWRTGSAPAVATTSSATSRGHHRRRPVALWLIPAVAALFVLAVGWTLGNQSPEERGGVLGAVASPAATAAASAAATSVAVALVPSPSPTRSPTPTLVPTAPPTPGPTVQPTPAPTLRATPRPTARPTPLPVVAPPALGSPATVVARFYNLVEAHDFDRAASLWTARMRRQYPPSGFIDGRFARTSRIDLRRNEVIAINTEAGTAVVAVDLIEYRDVKPKKRRFVGRWDMVLTNQGWRMDEPHF